MINPTLARQIDALRAQVDRSSVPDGVLAWFGAADFPDGSGGSPPLTQAEWEVQFLRLQQAAVLKGVIPPLFQVRAALAEFRPDGPLPVAIANYSLQVPKPGLVQQATAAAAAGTGLPDPPASLAEALQPARAFMAAGLLHDQWGHATPRFRSRVVTYLVDERFYFSNLNAPPPDLIELDPHDGGGARRVRFGQRVTVVYPRGQDTARATVRCTFAGETLESTFTVPIDGPPAAPFPDEEWKLTGFPSMNTGTAYVYRAPGHAAVRHPVIIAEGFPGGYPYHYLYELVNQHGMLELLRARGHDVVLLGFDRGTDLIQNNAQVMIAAIRRAMTEAKAPLVVGGVSMGGLVARYALAFMESRGMPHGTRLFFTVDTPHRGAYTSVAAQWFAHYFASASALAAGFAALLDSPANQQFMMYRVEGGVIQESPLRQRFLADLAHLGGFPRLPRRIAVSCGHGRGGRSPDIPPDSPAVVWSGSPFVSATLYTAPGSRQAQVVARGYNFLAPPQDAPDLTVAAYAWEGVPGGQNIYNRKAADIAASLGMGEVQDRIPDTCAIPTISALDLDQDPTAPVPSSPPEEASFHAYHCAETNQQHLVLTARSAKWLVNQIGKPAGSSGRTHVVLGGPHLDPHDPAFLADPYPVYARFREQAPVHWVDQYQSYWVFGYDDVKRVLEDTATFTKRRPKDPPPPPPPFDVLANLPQGVFMADPPLHTRLRGSLDQLFPGAIANADAVAASVGRSLLVAAKRSRRIELMSAYAYPLPAEVLGAVLGVPPQDWAGLRHWVEAILAGHDITKPAAVQGMGGTCSMAIIAYFQALQLCPAVNLPPGLVRGMMEQVAEGSLKGPELQTTLLNLLVAGYLSTSFLIGTGAYQLLRHPEQLALLRSDFEAHYPGAVLEMLRYEAPAQLVDRVVAVDEVELGWNGVKLHYGDTVTAVIGSANRSDHFPDPDRFDIRRTDGGVLTFGEGIHRCIGEPLVHLVAPAAFRTLLHELPEMQLAGTVQWQTDPYLRSVANLPLSITGAPGP